MRRASIVFAIVFVFLHWEAFAQSLTVVSEDFPPYNYSENNEAKGLSSEIVIEVLKEAGLETKINFYPWARSYLVAQNEPNVLIYSIARIPERENMFHWIGAIAPYRTSFYKLKENDRVGMIRSLADAKAYTIGVSVEDVIYTYLKSKRFSNLDVAGRDSLSIRKLVSGRVDLIAFDEVSFPYRLMLEELEPSRFERVYRLDDLTGELYMAMSKNSDPKLVKSLQQALKSVHQSGLYDSILGRYFEMK